MKTNYLKRFLSVILGLLIVINLVILPLGISAEEDVQIQYTQSYNAAEYIKAQVDNHTQGSATYYPKDAPWTMETTAIPTDTSNGYITDGTVWTTASLKMHGDPYPNEYKKHLVPYMYYTNDVSVTTNSAIKAGIMSDGKYAGITAGTQFEVISSLTFIAPQSGTVKLSDPNGGEFKWWLNHTSTGGQVGVDLGMDKFTTDPVVGLAVYKNNEKIWPTDAQYSSVTGAFSGRTIAFPEIKGVELAAGDKLRMVIIPIAASKRGYYEMNPEITYGADYIKTRFNAYEAVKSAEDVAAGSSSAMAFSDSNWSYETRTLATDTDTGYNLPTDADWTEKEIKYASGSNDSAFNEVFPKMFRAWPNGASYGYGIVTYENKLVTTCIPMMSNSAGKIASTITWTASKDGTVRLYDPESGKIGRLPKETDITQALDKQDGRIGIAIYKNSEQLWPAADSENSETIDGINYYMLTGDEYNGAELVAEGRTSVDFPELNDIKVAANDKLRIMIVPLKEEFGYMTLNPQVDYTALDDSEYANYPLSLQITGSGKDIKIYEVEQSTYEPENIQVVLNTGNGCYELVRDGSDPSLSYTMDKEISEDGSETFKIGYSYGSQQLSANFKVRVVDTVWGDVDMDGKINSVDASALLQYLLGTSKQSWHTAVFEVNDDTVINVKDLVRLKRHIADIQNVVLGPNKVDPTSPDESAEQKTVTKIENNSILRLNSGNEYEPYLQYGVQIKPDSIGRTSAEKLEYFKKAYELGFEMVAVPVYWNFIEVAEDEYDLYQVKQIIDYANKYGLDVELLWYGSNVLGHSDYVPSYIVKDTAIYPTLSDTGVFDYTDTDIFNRESAVLGKVMDYIYGYDTHNRVCAVQIENEPNWNKLLDNQKDAAVTYFNNLGQVVKNSKYSVVTRVNLCNYDDSNRTFDRELAEALVATAGIDCVGGDVYTNTASTSDFYIGKFDFSGNINLTAESGGAYSRYAQIAMNSFASGRGYIAYELRTSTDSKYDFGIYRQSDSEWIERDGSESVIKSGDPVNTYPEVKTSDILIFNHMVNKVRTQLVAAIYSGSSNFAMLSDEGADSLLSADGSVNGSAVTYKSGTTTQRPYNKAGLAFQYDGYWYFFTAAERAVFTFENYSGTMQTYNNGVWEDYAAGMEEYDNTMHFAAYSDRVYRIKVAE